MGYILGGWMMKVVFVIDYSSSGVVCVVSIDQSGDDANGACHYRRQCLTTQRMFLITIIPLGHSINLTYPCITRIKGPLHFPMTQGELHTNQTEPTDQIHQIHRRIPRRSKLKEIDDRP